MRQHCANANAVADYLAKHPKVTKVIFPEDDRRGQAPGRCLSEGWLRCLVGFELKGGREAGQKFIDALKMFYHVANIGDARSLAIHPATTTHSQLTAEEQSRPASPRVTSDSRSASNMPTISSPIWITPWPRRERACSDHGETSVGRGPLRRY